MSDELAAPGMRLSPLPLPPLTKRRTRLRTRLNPASANSSPEEEEEGEDEEEELEGEALGPPWLFRPNPAPPCAAASWSRCRLPS